MKRLFLCITVFFMLFTAACAAGTGSEENFDENFIKGDEKIDLEGFDFLIKYYSYVTLNEDSVLSFQSNSEFCDLVLQRIHEVEKNYNCKIKTQNMGRGDMAGSNFTPVIMSGSYFSDAAIVCDWDLRPYVEGEMFEPLSQISDIINYRDSEKWGTPNYLEWVVWNGELYGVLPMKWPEYYLTSFGHMFVFNEEFAKKLGQPDPREFVETDNWNRAQLGQMMETYTFTENDGEVRSLTQYPGHFVDMALRANNAQVYKYVDGKYVSGYHTPEGQDALEWAADFLHVSYRKNILPNDGDENNFKHFIEKKCAMLLTYTAYIYGSNASLSYELDDYCVLPFPNGPARQGEGYTGTFESVRNTLMFPLFGNDLTASALICDALFEQLGDYDEEALKDYYLKFFFHDERDFNVFYEVAENTRYSYFADGFRPQITERVMGANVSITSLLESTKNVYNNMVELRVVPTISTMSEVFGNQ